MKQNTEPCGIRSYKVVFFFVFDVYGDSNKNVVEYSLSRSLSQTMIAEYKTKLIDKGILQRKLAELYDMAEEEVKNSQQD